MKSGEADANFSSKLKCRVQRHVQWWHFNCALGSFSAEAPGCACTEKWLLAKSQESPKHPVKKKSGGSNMSVSSRTYPWILKWRCARNQHMGRLHTRSGVEVGSCIWKVTLQLICNWWSTNCDQGSVNYDQDSANWPWSKFISMPAVVNSFTAPQLHAFIYVPLMAAYPQYPRSWIVSMEIMRPTELKTFAVWSLMGKVYWSLL